MPFNIPQQDDTSKIVLLQKHVITIISKSAKGTSTRGNPLFLIRKFLKKTRAKERIIDREQSWRYLLHSNLIFDEYSVSLVFPVFDNNINLPNHSNLCLSSND